MVWVVKLCFAVTRQACGHIFAQTSRNGINCLYCGHRRKLRVKLSNLKYKKILS